MKLIEVGKTFLAAVFKDRSSFRYVLGTVFGLGFSIAVILCTIGVMDGYVWNLKKFLHVGGADLEVISVDGFYSFDSLDNELGQFEEVTLKAPVIHTEGFLILEDNSKGVLIKGIEPQSFNAITRLNVELKANEIAIGSELASILNIKVGDEVVLALANGNEKMSSRPTLTRLRIKKLINHGVYLKDSRIVYLSLEKLQTLLRVRDRVNMTLVNVNSNLLGEKSLEAFKKKMEGELSFQYRVKVFWQDFEYILQAVKTEKFMIGLTLQLIVLISIFNVLAFIFYMNDKYAGEIFLFKALGMSSKHFHRLWLIMIFAIWLLSCGVSFVFVEVFNYLLKNASIFQLPGEVYKISSIDIRLGLKDYLSVFAGAIIWLLIVSLPGLSRLKKKSILSGLRQEFS